MLAPRSWARSDRQLDKELRGEAYSNGANEVGRAGHDVGQADAEQGRENPRAHEAFHRLLGGKLDQLRAAKRDAANVGEDVVRDHQGDGREEPDHALEDVVHDEVRRKDDDKERHVRPRELGELEAVVALLEGSHEEYEAYEACQRRRPDRRERIHRPITYSMKLMNLW